MLTFNTAASSRDLQVIAFENTLLCCCRVHRIRLFSAPVSGHFQDNLRIAGWCSSYLRHATLGCILTTVSGLKSSLLRSVLSFAIFVTAFIEVPNEIVLVPLSYLWNCVFHIIYFIFQFFRLYQLRSVVMVAYRQAQPDLLRASFAVNNRTMVDIPMTSISYGQPSDGEQSSVKKAVTKPRRGYAQASDLE